MGEPCPPLVIGVGVGGLVDSVMNLSKRAIFRSPLGTPNPDPAVAEIEKELLAQINSLDLGPMGLGGKRYSLAVNMELNGAHTSEMLLGISIQCWASRYSTARIYDDERAEYITHPKGDGVL